MLLCTVLRSRTQDMLLTWQLAMLNCTQFSICAKAHRHRGYWGRDCSEPCMLAQDHILMELRHRQLLCMCDRQQLELRTCRVWQDVLHISRSFAVM